MPLCKTSIFCPILNKIHIRRQNFVKKMETLNVTKVLLVGVALFHANTRKGGLIMMLIFSICSSNAPKISLRAHRTIKHLFLLNVCV